MGLWTSVRHGTLKKKDKMPSRTVQVKASKRRLASGKIVSVKAYTRMNLRQLNAQEKLIKRYMARAKSHVPRGYTYYGDEGPVNPSAYNHWGTKLWKLEEARKAYKEKTGWYKRRARARRAAKKK